MKVGYAMIRNSTDPIEDQIKVLKDKGCIRVYKEILTDQKNSLFSLRELLEELNEGDTVCLQNLTLIAISIDAPTGLLDVLMKKKCSLEITDKNRTFKYDELANLSLMWKDLIQCRERIKSRSVKKSLEKRQKN